MHVYIEIYTNFALALYTNVSVRKSHTPATALCPTLLGKVIISLVLKKSIPYWIMGGCSFLKRGYRKSNEGAHSLIIYLYAIRMADPGFVVKGMTIILHVYRLKNCMFKIWSNFKTTTCKRSKRENFGVHILYLVWFENWNTLIIRILDICTHALCVHLRNKPQVKNIKL